MKNLIIETWAPIFPGFYGTYFDLDTKEDILIESVNECRIEKHLKGNVEFEHLDIDYNKFYVEFGKELCYFLEDNLSEFVTSIKFGSLNSPKEYNFRNDSYDCSVEISTNNIRKIRQIILANIAKYTNYIGTRYTSHDGFLSFHSTNMIDWGYDVNTNQLKLKSVLTDTHKIGALLNFICILKDIDEECLYESCYDVVDLELTEESANNSYNNNFCENCLVFYGKDTIPNIDKQRIETYKKLMGKAPKVIPANICPECLNE